MTIRRGMSGDLVLRIQQRLRELKLYQGPLDSSFGGGSEAGVKTFQKQHSLTATGAVDSATWAMLFPGEPAPVSPLSFAPVSQRCLALTGSFETGAQPPDCYSMMTGDFDGQGISFGVLQWNVGQGSLQPLLREMIENHPDVSSDIFHEHLETLTSLAAAPLAEQLEFARSLQSGGQVVEPWRGMLKALGRTKEFQDIQVRHAASQYERARAMCVEYGLTSQRAAALMFDILTQNGSINAIIKAQIFADFSLLTTTGQDAEVARMRIIANRRAAASRAEFVDDVRTRKLTIANGQGSVHGIPYDLEDVFCLTLNPF